MRLIFLSYINRSGSSFLFQKISEMNDVFVFPEGDVLIDNLLLKSNDDIENIKDQFVQLIQTDFKLKHWGITDKELDVIFLQKTVSDIFIQFLITYKNKFKSEASILLFKRSDIFSSFTQIEQVLLDYTLSFLCLYRDPRAIFCSQKTTINPATNAPFNLNPVVTANSWNVFTDFILKHSEPISVSYEKLIENFDSVFPELLSKLSIQSINNSKTTYAYILPENQKKIHPNITSSTLIEKTTNWEKNIQTSEQRIIETICRKNLKKLNYQMTFQNMNFANYIQLLYLKFRIFFGIDKY